jgi:hypothetical protein
MSSESPQPPSSGRDVCGAPDALEGVCRQPATHEVEVNAPKRGHDVSRRCADCAERARGRTYVRDVRPITLETDAVEAAGAIYDHFRFTRAIHAKIGYTPAVRVDVERETLCVARGSLLYIRDGSPWRGAHVLVEDAPDYFEVTRPTCSDASDWLEAVSTYVCETIVDADGREWSLPTEAIAEALREGAFLEEGSR